MLKTEIITLKYLQCLCINVLFILVCGLCLVTFKQALVWDDKLTGPFGLIAEYKLLKVS